MRVLADRSPPEGSLALGAAWLGFVLAFALSLPQPPRPLHVAAGALVGALLVLAGFAAAWRVRPLAAREGRARVRLGALSLLLGGGMGAVLLGLLVLLARAEPRLRARFTGRLEEPAWRPIALGFEASILEEVALRLFVMSVVAWVAARLLPRRWAIGIAAAVSTALFGLIHLPAWSAATETSPLLLASVLGLNGAAALLLAWVFWRWGLPYAILAHFAGDVVIQSLAPRLVG